MKKLIVFSILLLQISACNNDETANKETTASENDLDAARNFIRSSLDGKWSDARKFMVQDSSNIERLNTIEDFYKTESPDDKRGYREASITTYDSRKINDSITIVNYSNSYKNQKDSLKIVRVNGQWLVDLKYSFLPTDSVKNVL